MTRKWRFCHVRGMGSFGCKRTHKYDSMDTHFMPEKQSLKFFCSCPSVAKENGLKIGPVA
ncbi:hypothetical protein BN2476_560107 [Paraburkholderia piptadeniae]|uniref:Uncharacterized protein n=1 Tax=Paraburkholderia piptadeniae TaxID=1701573 RepID=A0A1N7SIZ7_9BURK|nr:hypothetical protein BN2476_560107 [Paraburkholderia piptadeniae]